MNSYNLLKQLRIEQEQNRLAAETGYFDHKYEVKRPKTAAQLEALVQELIQRLGGVCTVIYAGGRQLVKTHDVKDVLGNKRKLIDHKYIPSTTTPGTADLLACIDGQYYALEVKFSLGDRQNAAQKKFERQVKDAGGTYLIIKTLDDVLEIYEKFTLT